MTHILVPSLIIVFLLVNPIGFVLLAAEVAKILDKLDGVVDHGVISKIPLVFSLKFYMIMTI